HHARLIRLLHFPEDAAGPEPVSRHPAARGVAVALDAAEPLDRVEEPGLAADRQVEPGVAVGDDVSPAASFALATHASASRYCSRKIEPPSADLNERPRRLSVNQRGRGYEPVMAVGSIMFRVTFSIDSSWAISARTPSAP